MMQATGSSFFTQAMALATANATSTALPELIAFMGNRLGQTRANQLLAKVGHLLTLEQQYTLQETYLYGSSRLGVKNQNIPLSTRVASVQNGSLTPIGNAILNTDSVFSGTAAVYGLPKAPTARIFNRTWGLKQYELSNHLGNVQVTISDKKLGVVGANQVDFIAYEPEVKSATDYYAYGMEMPGKGYQSIAYRYGMNTQEKDNEIYGPGNTLGALYWEYDARIARRWNVDPVVVPSLSNYHAFEGNPIMMVDPLGNSASTHTDEDGNVIAVRDDGDKGIYKHKGKVAEAMKEYLEKYSESNKSAGGKLMGYSLTAYSFADGKELKNNGIVIADNDAKIDFKSDWARNAVNDLIYKMEGKSLIYYGINARSSNSEKEPFEFDLKYFSAKYYKSIYFGSILYGNVYASGRDAGNFAAGLIQKRSFIPNFWISVAYGIYQQRQINNKVFKPPFYGEEIQSGSAIKAGRNFNGGKYLW